MLDQYKQREIVRNEEKRKNEEELAKIQQYMKKLDNKDRLQKMENERK